ncbi:MAG TPA: adenylate/guanylate cyclase domain-containing protein [Stenomitos sp.]
MSELLANRYRIRSKLGRGGMGTVYEVEDAIHGSVLAMKVIRSKGAMTSEQRLRFMEEFRAMSRLRHPNTLEVFDYGQLDDASAFFTMEIVTGQELTSLIREEALPLSRIFHLLIQLLQALGFIHSRLYVHRDIKSSNIRIKQGDLLKLMDFGLMDQLGTPSNGKITGTPGYLPPEVAKGGIIDASSDIYSVGCLAYELIRGRLPFVGDVGEVIWAHLNDQPEPLRRFRPEVSPRLEAVVMRMMEKDQKKRYQKVSEVIEDLADLSGIAVTREDLAHKRSYLTSSVLVGRDQELSLLEEALAQVRNGTGRSVFVGAPAGTGKSRLAQELVLQAKLLNVPVLHASCLETGMAPYEPMTQALHPLLALSSDEEIERHGPVLAKLFPDLIKQGIQPAPTLLSKLESARLNETVVSWLQDVSSRTPLILNVDDLHWIDPSSQEVFNHCIRRMQGHPLLCLGTLRSEEAPPGSSLWFTVDEGITHYLRLSTFDLPQSMQFLQAMLGEVQIADAFAQFLFEATAGNAFFLTEMVRYLMEAGMLVFKQDSWHFPANVGDVSLPTSLETTILRRLSQLSPEARSLARMASIQGRYADRDLLFAMLGGHEEAFFACIDELIEGQFIIKDGARYAFPHDRVREALYHDVPVADRQALHLRVASYLEKKNGDRLDAVINELAHHYSRSTEHEKAYRYLRMAGDLAAANGVFGLAIQHWKQASALLDDLDLPDREAQQIGLLDELSAKAYLISPPVTAEAFGRLIQLREAQGDLVRICRILKVTQRLSGHVPVPREARRPIASRRPRRRVGRDLARFTPPRLSTWVKRILESYGYLGVTHGYLGDPLKGLALFRKALTLNPFPGSPLEGGILVTKASCLFSMGRIDEIQRLIDTAEAWLVETHVRQDPTLFISWTGLPGSRLFVGFQGYRPSEAHLAEALDRCDRFKNYSLKSLFWGRYAIWFAWTGRWQEALAIVEQMDQNSRRVGAPPFRYALYIRAYILWQRGEFDEALSTIEQSLCYPGVKEDGYVLHSFFLLRGQVHLSRGDLDKAASDLSSTLAACQQAQIGIVYLQAKIRMGMLARAQGNLEEALQHLQMAHDLASTPELRNPLFQALASRWSGEVAMAAGDLGAAKRHLDAAWDIVTLREQDNWFEQGQLQRAYGELSRLSGDGEAARASFQKAADMFRTLNNRYWLRLVTAELENLRDSELTREEAVGPAWEPEGRFAEISSKWQETLLSIPAAHRDPSQVYDTILAACADMFDAQEASLFVAQPQPSGDYAPHASAGHWLASRDPSGPCAPLPVNASLLNQVCQKQVGLAGYDLPSEASLSLGSTFDKDIPSVLIAPLKLADHPTLVIYLKRSSSESQFDNRDRDLLSSFSDVLSSSMNLSLSGEWAFGADGMPSFERRIPAGQPPSHASASPEAAWRAVKALSEMAQAVSGMTDQEDLAEAILIQCLHVAGAERGVVLMGSELQPLAAVDHQHRPLSGEVFSRSLAKRAFDSCQPVVMLDVPQAHDTSDSVHRLAIQSVMCLPLVARGQALGVLYVSSHVAPVRFGSEPLGILEAIAAQAALALQNAMLFKDLQKSLERERRALREKSSMARYVSGAARRAAESMGGEEAHQGHLQLATIMFIDVRGFTTMSERTDPRDVVLILNTYLTHMEQIILAHGGNVDKFIGDGIMAVFLHDGGDEVDAAVRAAETAIAMQAAMAAMNDQHLFPGDQEIRIGIGINTGEVVVGNIGATTRMDHTVIGDNVNLAARLESNAKPGTIMVSASTAARLAARFSLKPFGTLTVKGKTQPVEVFTVDLDAGGLRYPGSVNH